MSRQRFYAVLLLLYAAILGLVTLVPRSPSAGTPPDLVPFRQTLELLADARDEADAAAPIVGNIVLFVPLGWLLPMVWPGIRTLRGIVLIATLCSAGIELCQWLFVTGRSPTIDDVIFNALGAAVGAVMFFAPRAA